MRCGTGRWSPAYRLRRWRGVTIPRRYYAATTEGEAAEGKGVIQLDEDAKVEIKPDQPDVVQLTVGSRTYKLTAKSQWDATFWKAFFERASQGLPDSAFYSPLEADAPEAGQIAKMQAEISVSPRQASVKRIDPDDSSGGAAVEEPGDRFKVIDAFKSEPGEGTLDLAAGDIVSVDEKGDTGWWYAVGKDETAAGWMPESLLEPHVPAPKPAASAELSKPGNPFGGVTFGGGASGESSTDPEPEQPEVQPPAVEGEPFVVTEAFKSEPGEGTLDLAPGDAVVVDEKGDTGICPHQPRDQPRARHPQLCSLERTRGTRGCYAFP